MRRTDAHRAQAAEKLGVKEGTVRALVASRRLRHCRIGTGRGVIRIPLDAVEEYIRSVTVAADPGPAPAPEQAWRKKVTSRYFRL